MLTGQEKQYRLKSPHLMFAGKISLFLIEIRKSMTYNSFVNSVDNGTFKK